MWLMAFQKDLFFTILSVDHPSAIRTGANPALTTSLLPNRLSIDTLGDVKVFPATPLLASWTQDMEAEGLRSDHDRWVLPELLTLQALPVSNHPIRRQTMVHRLAVDDATCTCEVFGSRITTTNDPHAVVT